MKKDIEKMVQNSRKMTKEEKENQRKNFVYGNLKIENENISEKVVDIISKEMNKNE